MIYACTNEEYALVDLGSGDEPQPCPAYMVEREIDEPDDEALDANEPSRWCGTCGYPLSRFPDGIDGAPEEVEGWTPPEPEPFEDSDPSPQQWAEVRYVRDQQLRQTDWITNQPPDLPQELRDVIAPALPEWETWRQELRDLQVAEGQPPIAPSEVVWPWPQPASPVTALTSPPPFVRLVVPNAIARLEGAATLDESTGIARLTSATQTPPGYSGLEYVIADGLTPATMSVLRVAWMAEVGGIGGGSPRFVFTIDDQPALVMIGPTPDFTGEPQKTPLAVPLGEWQQSPNYVGGSALRVDISAHGGSPYTDWAALVALLGDHEITAAEVIVDSSWMFDPQVVQVRDAVIT